MSHRYRGHRADSFKTSDLPELVEIRARQRTFHGAYSRTALANLGYALTFLRLFDRRFYNIGILFAVLGGLLYVIAYFRARHSRHDFADQHKEDVVYPNAIKSVGQSGPIFGRPFITAGWIVIAVSCVVAGMEIALLVLILKI